MGNTQVKDNTNNTKDPHQTTPILTDKEKDEYIQTAYKTLLKCTLADVKKDPSCKYWTEDQILQGKQDLIRSTFKERLNGQLGTDELEKLSWHRVYTDGNEAKQAIITQLLKEFPLKKPVKVVIPAATLPALQNFSFTYRTNTFTGNDALVAWIVQCMVNPIFADFGDKLYCSVVDKMKAITPPNPSNPTLVDEAAATDIKGEKGRESDYAQQVLKMYNEAHAELKESSDTQIAMYGDNANYGTYVYPAQYTIK